ncbi:PPOX class F420-dependent oxidoreductase [Kineococcus sp. T13]|nr:PPOX class F420-dependent oxidoreductase [Kineococcus vitellinus]
MSGLLARARYVQLTTFRRDGRAVPTPVWVGRLPDGRLVAVTEAGLGKVKRIRREPRVQLVPCTVRGTPRGRPVEARAELLGDDALPAADAALVAAYGWQYRTYRAFERLLQRLGRFDGQRVAIALTVTG